MQKSFYVQPDSLFNRTNIGSSSRTVAFDCTARARLRAIPAQRVWMLSEPEFAELQWVLTFLNAAEQSQAAQFGCAVGIVDDQSEADARTGSGPGPKSDGVPWEHQVIGREVA